MNQSSLTKALIINLDKGKRIGCMFNPNEYTFSKQTRWRPARRAGANMPKLEFGGGEPATLRMQLFFDSYNTQADVRKTHTDQIWELMLVDEGLKDPKNQKGRPPLVRFQWGAAWSFDAVITQLSQRFTLFLPDGTPVRATLDVTFQQIKEEKLYPPQNPTSGGIGGERNWKVQQGDTLAWIAYKEYGDTSRWRDIADANQETLNDLRSLTPGMLLYIPNI